MKKDILIILLFILLSDMLFGQERGHASLGFEQIEENLLTQLAIYPQEKIHLHTDRDLYVPGEKIWFKVYLTDAATLLYPTNSRYVYVELIDAYNTLVNRVMIHPENKMFYGHLPISKIIPEGNYTLRAYTRYMENLGDDYFFKKNIRIGNLSSGKGESSGSGGNNNEEIRITNNGSKNGFANYEKNKGNRENFEVYFFPEGGNLVEGVFCKVAFKVLDQTGYAETITGEMVDEDGLIITPVETIHAGMGVFSYIPQHGKRYWLKCRNGNGLEKQFELPHPEPRACALTVTQRNKRISVGVRKTAQMPLSPFGGGQGEDLSETQASGFPLYLLGHCHGQVFHFGAWDSINEFIVFPEEILPAGVIQFVLFDEQMNPLSERLVFSKNYNFVTADFNTDKSVYKTRENVKISLLIPSVPDIAGEGLEEPGHLSIAITDDKDIEVDSYTTILSSLLLSSELKGYIENPAWYLQDNAESAIALDYLMLTHGWRRYNIPEVIKGNYETPQIPFQTGQEISGKVQGGSRSRPVPGKEVLIMAKEGDFGLTSTDMNGAFVFDEFEYPDSTSYLIRALGNNPVELMLNGESFPKLTYAPQNLFFRQKTMDTSTKDIEDIDSGIEDAFITKAAQRAKYDDGMRVIQLNEVVVTAQRIERKDESRLQYWANRSSDVTIRREEIEKKSPKLVTELLLSVSGLHVFPSGEIRIRGSSYRPLVLIDGVPVAWPKLGDDEIMVTHLSPLETVSVHDIESIDVIKGTGVAMFGTRGEGGIISITTKRGIDVIRETESFRERKVLNYVNYTPLGFQKPVEFYSPRYETLETKYLNIPDYRTTIFWKPDIVISEEGEARFDFYTSDFPTTYSVVIEGLTIDGRIIRQVERIVVGD